MAAGSSRKPVTTAAVAMIMAEVEMTTAVAAATTEEAPLGVPSLVEAAVATPAALETTEVVPLVLIEGYGSKATEKDGSFFCEFRSERKSLGDRPLESLCILCMPEYENFHVSHFLTSSQFSV